MVELIKESAGQELKSYVGMQIKLRRTERKMTIRDLSKATGITEAALSKIERGESDMKLSTLALLRNALELEIEVKSKTI